MILKLAAIAAGQQERLQEAACGSEAVHQNLAGPFEFVSQSLGFLVTFAAVAFARTYSTAQEMMAAIQVSEADQLLAMFLACFAGCNFPVLAAASYLEHQVPENP